MKASSLSHLTAVSGANCAIVTAAAFALAAAAGFGRGIRVMAALLALVGFIVLVTPESSVVRAGAMAVVVLIALASGRPGGGIAAAGVAVIVLLCVDPWYSRDYGFALSVWRHGGLVAAGRPVGEGDGTRDADTARDRARRAARGAARVSAACSSCSTPPSRSTACPRTCSRLQPRRSARSLGLIGCLLLPIAAVGRVRVPPGRVGAGELDRARRARPRPLCRSGDCRGFRMPRARCCSSCAPRSCSGSCSIARRSHGFALPRSRCCSIAVAVPVGLSVRRPDARPGLRPGSWTLAACDIGQGDAVLLRSGGATALIDTGPDPAAVAPVPRRSWHRPHRPARAHPLGRRSRRRDIDAVVGRVDTVVHGPLDGDAVEPGTRPAHRRGSPCRRGDRRRSRVPGRRTVAGALAQARCGAGKRRERVIDVETRPSTVASSSATSAKKRSAGCSRQRRPRCRRRREGRAPRLGRSERSNCTRSSTRPWASSASAQRTATDIRPTACSSILARTGTAAVRTDRSGTALLTAATPDSRSGPSEPTSASVPDRRLDAERRHGGSTHRRRCGTVEGRRSRSCRGTRCGRHRSCSSPAPKTCSPNVPSRCCATSCRAEDPSLEVSDLEADGYRRGELLTLASPSLFGEPRLIRVSAVEKSTDDFLPRRSTTSSRPPTAPPSCCATAAGSAARSCSTRSVPAPAAASRSSAPNSSATPTSRTSWPPSSVPRAARSARAPCVRSSRRSATTCANSQPRAGSCIADSPGDITEAVVAKYYGGQVETNAFAVADAAIAGRYGEALIALRHALDSGADPVPMVAAFAMKVRTMAKVSGARGGGPQLASSLGLAPWQVDRARRDLAGWTDAGLAARSKRSPPPMRRSRAPSAIRCSRSSASSASSPRAAERSR